MIEILYRHMLRAREFNLLEEREISQSWCAHFVRLLLSLKFISTGALRKGLLAQGVLIKANRLLSLLARNALNLTEEEVEFIDKPERRRRKRSDFTRL